MNIMIFDTETISLDKPFCYNIGYIIMNTDGTTLKTADYVVEQVWHNPMLFSTAYYADKKPLYVKAMRQHKTIMDKFGFICQAMKRDIKAYNVEYAFAYNSPFDERVFNFNCDWFRCINPFDNIPIYDIRGYTHKFICDDNFKKWCEVNQRFSESGNYSTTAETIYQYIANDTNFIEEHTALADSIIEAMILKVCLDKGAKINGNYLPYRSIPRKVLKDFTLKYNDEIVFNEQVETIRYMKSKNTVILKG